MLITDRKNNPEIYILWWIEKNCDTKNHSFFVHNEKWGWKLFTNANEKNAFLFVNNVLLLSNNKQNLFVVRVQFVKNTEKQHHVVSQNHHRIDINGG